MRRVRSVITETALGDAVRDWVRTMYDIGKLTLSETSIELHLKDLLTETDPKKRLAMVEQAIKGEWKNFYPLKPEAKTKPDKSAGTAPMPKLERHGKWL